MEADMGNKLDIYRSLGGVVKQLHLGEVLATNQESQKYGLVFSAAEAEELIQVRNLAIRTHGRVELGVEVVQKIIIAFSRSAFINQDEYAATIGELLDMFYQMKNETDDEMGDEELIALMLEYYNGSCEGSLDLLRDRELALFAGTFRSIRLEKEAALQGSKSDDSKEYREI
jgi:hypothetical protein